MPTPPQSTGYPCAFSFLGCRTIEPYKPNWLSHNRSHLGTTPPPPIAVCPFCRHVFNNPQPGTTYAGNMSAWDQCLECFASHIEEGAKLDRPMKDVKLYRYLFQNKLIKVEQYQELVQEGQVRRGPPVIRFERRERGRASGRRQRC